MIDTMIERTFPLAKAAKKYASTRGERTVHPATLHRWRNPGIGGITLECLKVGGVWHTSAQALQRFFERLTEAQETSGGTVPPAPTRSTKRAATAASGAYHDQVNDELDAILGVASPPHQGPSVESNSVAHSE